MTFEEFLDAELTGLRRYATALTGDPQRAHDVLADALLRAHTGWGRIAAMQFPAAYVRRMVTSTFLSERRRWSVRHIRPTRTGEVPEVALPDPASAVDDREHLTHLLAALPPRQRAAVVLRYFLDLSHAEIATELGITTGAVRTAISRGLAALRITATDEDAAGPDPGPGKGPGTESSEQPGTGPGKGPGTESGTEPGEETDTDVVTDRPVHRRGSRADSRVVGAPPIPHPATGRRTETERS